VTDGIGPSCFHLSFPLQMARGGRGRRVQNEFSTGSAIHKARNISFITSCRAPSRRQCRGQSTAGPRSGCVAVPSRRFDL